MKIAVISGFSQSLVNFRGDMIKDMVNLGHEVIAIGPEGGYEDRLAALGARFIQLPYDRRSTNPLSDIHLLKSLYILLMKERPNLVFSYTMKPVIYGSIAARLTGIKKTYAMVTGLGQIYAFDGWKTRLVRLVTNCLYRIALSSCKKVFLQNNDDLSYFLNKKITKQDKCILINGSGVNLEKYPASPLPRKPVFLMMARLIRSKGVLDYCEAAALVKRQYPVARFLLLGQMEKGNDAVSQAELEPFVNNGAIEYLGFSEDVRPLLKECSVYVLPSAYREGIPRSILEAMASGRPIITTDFPGCRETVDNNVNGFLIPIRDHNALCNRMIWFIQHYDRAQDMGIKSLDKCQKRFDVIKVNRVLLENMELLINDVGW